MHLAKKPAIHSGFLENIKAGSIKRDKNDKGGGRRLRTPNLSSH